ncbi:2-oxoadipate dioxygenase/decarboxylase family protein [Pseudomonas oryzihabitans]
MHDAHRLIADVVCFKSLHINYPSPRTLDIDDVQA